jgi:hypothetical protein
MLVKSIDTWPALADSEVVLYFSWPSGLASSFSDCAAPDAAPVVGVAAGVEAVVAGVDAAVLELELLDEPQPARTASAATNANAESLRMGRVAAVPAGETLTSQILRL